MAWGRLGTSGWVSAGSGLSSHWFAASKTLLNGAAPLAVRAVRAGPGLSARRAAADSRARVMSGVRPAVAATAEMPAVVANLPAAGAQNARGSDRCGDNLR